MRAPNSWNDSECCDEEKHPKPLPKFLIKSTFANRKNIIEAFYYIKINFCHAVLI